MLGVLRWLSGKEFACQAGDTGSIPGLGRFHWRKKWQPTAVVLPGELHGQRSLTGYSPWGHRDLDKTERLIIAQYTYIEIEIDVYRDIHI